MQPHGTLHPPSHHEQSDSLQAATDLLDKRGANYCDRPEFVLFHIMGFRATLTFLRWSPRFRLHRRLLQSSLSKRNITQFEDLQLHEARRTLQALLAAPDDWEKALRRYATAVVLGVGFGVSVESDEDPYIQMAADVSYALAHGGAPAGTLVDVLPFLRYFPTCLAPFASLRFVRKWHAAIRSIHEIPFAAVQRDFKEGKSRPSFVQQQLQARAIATERGDKHEMTLEDIQGAAGALFAAGQDTTWSTLVVFVLNMVLNPAVQLRAQEELDSIVGSERLPAFSDRSSLPHLEFVLQETLRWCPVSPLGVPHKSLEEDVYRGMCIPAGSIVYANARAMCYDRDIYRNPEVFDPMRYAPYQRAAVRSPCLWANSASEGGQICVGRHFADATLWIMMATMLATLNFDKALNDDGMPITPEVTLTPGLTSHPDRFPCRLSSRSKRAEQLIRREMNS
ncbi:cytochrome P450 [Schizophyllum fasciatum]